MANVIINSDLYDKDFVRDFTYGFEDFEDAAGNPHKGFKSLVLEQYTLERAAMTTGIPTDIIARLAGEFATNRPAVAVLPTEAGEYAGGNSLYTAMAVHALNALVGSIDCPGGVLVQRFPSMADWPEFDLDGAAQKSLAQERLDGAGSAALPLAGSVYQNVAGRILTDEPYPLNALMLLNANPVYDAPENGRFVQALMKVPFVVSFASTLDESAAHADLILPASTFLEIWGDDYIEGTGYAGVSLRQPVVEAVHDTRNPGDVLLELADRLGGALSDALPWSDYKSLVEYRLSGVGMDWDKFVANGNWSEMIYFNAEPGSEAWADVVGRDRLNAPDDGRFDLFSRELIALLDSPDDLACLPHFEQPQTLKDDTPEAAEYPLLLVSQSILTHTPGWQGIIPTLQESYGLQSNVKWGSWVEINPRVAEGLGVENGDQVWVESQVGRIQAPVRIYEGLWPNAVFIPPGQGHRTLVQWGRGAPEQSQVGVNPNQLAAMGTEALNGQAVFSPVRVRVYKA
jgi:anaerobic selenocysteine-containing dehydrogenase